MIEQRVRCRPIDHADLPGVAALLARGFPARPLSYWQRGLDRLAGREVPDGNPRFGYLLERGGVPVGALLMIVQTVTHAGDPFIRCNLASWYVEPAARSHAAMLSIMSLRNKGATHLNISAAPNTWATIEAQGFRRFSWGQRLTLPLLSARGWRARLAPFDAARDGALPEAPLLADHARMGCLALVGRDGAGAAPLVLMPMRAKQGRFPVPAMQLVFCRDIADLGRFAAPLGRLLLKRGMPFLLHDHPPGAPGLPGLDLPGRARKYVRGAREPRLGDLAYTEFTIFGA